MLGVLNVLSVVHGGGRGLGLFWVRGLGSRLVVRGGFTFQGLVVRVQVVKVSGCPSSLPWFKVGLGVRD